MSSASSSHLLLSQVSESKRDVEAEALSQLTEYRTKLVRMFEQAGLQKEQLIKERELQMRDGAQATELMMLEQSMLEYQQQVDDIQRDILALDLAISQQRKKWAKQHKKHKTHEGMHHKLQKKAKQAAEQKHQKDMDDQFSSRLFAKNKVE